MFNFLRRFKKSKEGETGLVPDPRPKEEKEQDYQVEEILEAIVVAWEDKKPEQWRKFPIFFQNGSGSCFPANASVLMEDFNTKPISRIKVGDIVITHNGSKKRVTRIFKRKWQGATRILKVRGIVEEIEATNEHPVFAIKRLKDRKPYGEVPHFYPISELKEGDWVAVSAFNEVRDATIRTIEKDPDFLWVLGLYLAEGFVDKYTVAFSLHKKETDLYERMKRAMAKYSANVTVFFKKSDNGMRVSIQGQEWARLFEELGGKLCDKKRIADRLMFIEPHLQMKIVEGLFDGDGHNRGERKILVSTSPFLIQQTKNILLRNGIYSFVQKRKDIEGRKQSYNLEYSKSSRYSFIQDRWFFVQIASVQNKKAFQGGHVYNIEVEDDNSYIIDGVVVHNCVAQTIAKVLGVENFIEEEKFVHFSARDIYSRRANMPSPGMWLQDALHIGYKYGATLEQLMPSQGLNEQQMNNKLDKKTIDEQIALIGKGGNYVQSGDIDFDKIAQVIKQGKSVGLACRFDKGDWATGEVINRKDGEYGHLVAGVDYCMWKGKKAIVFDNSWDYKWGFNGQGVITEDQPIRAWGYFQFLKNTWRDEEKELPKPKYTFKRDLIYGMKNVDVIRLQECLRYEELFPVNIDTTGYYSVITSKAVLEFQMKYEVAPTEELTALNGRRVGSKTRTALNKIFS